MWQHAGRTYYVDTLLLLRAPDLSSFTSGVEEIAATVGDEYNVHHLFTGAKMETPIEEQIIARVPPEHTDKIIVQGVIVKLHERHPYNDSRGEWATVVALGAEMRLRSWARLRCKHSCLYLTADGSGRLRQAAEGSGDNQLFRFEPRDGGPYGVLRVKHSGQVLDVSGASLDDGAHLILYNEHGGANQLFRFEPTAKGAGVFRAKHSGKAVDVEGKSHKEGAGVHQWKVCGVDNQSFTPE